MVESLEALHSLDGNEDRLFRVVIYSVNQKGRSPKVVLKDLLIGDRDHHSACKDFGFSILFSLYVCLSVHLIFVFYFFISKAIIAENLLFLFLSKPNHSLIISMLISLSMSFILFVLLFQLWKVVHFQCRRYSPVFP